MKACCSNRTSNSDENTRKHHFLQSNTSNTPKATNSQKKHPHIKNTSPSKTNKNTSLHTPPKPQAQPQTPPCQFYSEHLRWRQQRELGPLRWKNCWKNPRRKPRKPSRRATTRRLWAAGRLRQFFLEEAGWLGRQLFRNIVFEGNEEVNYFDIWFVFSSQCFCCFFKA